MLLPRAVMGGGAVRAVLNSEIHDPTLEKQPI